MALLLLLWICRFRMFDAMEATSLEWNSLPQAARYPNEFAPQEGGELDTNLSRAAYSDPTVPFRVFRLFTSGIIRPSNFSALRFWNLGLIKINQERNMQTFINYRIKMALAFILVMIGTASLVCAETVFPTISTDELKTLLTKNKIHSDWFKNRSGIQRVAHRQFHKHTWKKAAG